MKDQTDKTKLGKRTFDNINSSKSKQEGESTAVDNRPSISKRRRFDPDGITIDKVDESMADQFGDLLGEIYQPPSNDEANMVNVYDDSLPIQEFFEIVVKNANKDPSKLAKYL